MSDRLRGAIARLNEVAPDDAVYERAKQGPRPGSPEKAPSRSKRLVVVATAFAVFIPAAVFAWQAFKPAGRSTLQSATPTASATPPPGLLMGSFDAVLHAPGEITAMAASGGQLYLSTSVLEGGRGAARTIVRWNAAGGGPIRQSEPLPGDGLAIAGGSLWAPGGSPRNDTTQGLPQAPWLYQLDPKTLSITAKIQTGSPPTAIVVSPSGRLWVGAGDRVLEIDPLKAKVAFSSISVQGHVQRLAIDPSGSHLYVSTDARVANYQNLLLELDTATGTVLASSGAGVIDFEGPSALAATDAGVWITTPTGLMGGAYFVPEGLSRIAPGKPVGLKSGSNATIASLAGGVLWVSDGSTPLVCADPNTGRVRARIPMVGDAAVYGPVVEGPGLYIAAFDWLVHIVLPPAACGVPDSLVGHG